MTAIMVAQTTTAIQPLVLNLNNHTLRDDEVISPASCGVTFGSNGQITFIGNGNPPSPDLNEWIKWQVGFNRGAEFEVAYTALVSGLDPNVGFGLGLYQNLATGKGWRHDAGGGDSRTGVWRFRVREVLDVANFAEADFDVTAFSSPA